MKKEPEVKMHENADSRRKPYHPPKILSRQNLEAVAADCGKTDRVVACPARPPVIS